MKQIGIIGGGASGMMAAITAASYGKVTVLEHTDKVVKKILSTGNGKCNFTNLELSEDDYFGNHPSFLMDAMQRFGPKEMTSFLEGNGILTISKRGGYMYPFSGQASTIADFFEKRAYELGVIIERDRKSQKICVKQMEDRNLFLVETANGTTYEFDKLIFACGGKAFESSGSDGSGFSLLKPFGFTIKKMYPVLAPIFVSDPQLKQLAGVRCDATATCKIDGEIALSDTGEVQFTKDTVSGIPVFQLTHYATKAFGEGKEVQIWIDFLPQMDINESDTYLKTIANTRNVSIGELLSGVLNKKVMQAVLDRLKISEKTKAEELKEKQWKKINSSIHNFVFTMSKQSDFQKAQATRGGVSIDEVDENMMVKKLPGMYIVGEMLDMDGKCGGYNLQWAFTSGYLAGLHAAKY